MIQKKKKKKQLCPIQHSLYVNDSGHAVAICMPNKCHSGPVIFYIIVRDL